MDIYYGVTESEIEGKTKCVECGATYDQYSRLAKIEFKNKYILVLCVKCSKKLISNIINSFI